MPPSDDTQRAAAADLHFASVSDRDELDECPSCKSSLGLTYVDGGGVACIICGWVQPAVFHSASHGLAEQAGEQR